MPGNGSRGGLISFKTKSWENVLKEFAAMTYMKLITGGAKRHLALADQPSTDVTLCGCTVTQVHNWKRIAGLEGDECPHCAELAFGVGTDRRIPLARATAAGHAH
jgi:hypothetical protein